MVQLILILIAILILGVLGFLKLRKSNFVNNLTKDLWNEAEPTTTETIKDISSAEKALIAKQKLADKDAEKQKKESQRIGDYLAEKGVVKPIVEKGKEADDKEEVK
jgi:hypothetical protein